MNPSLYEKVILPSSKRRLLARMRGFDAASSEEQARLVRQRLRHILTVAYESVPYYRRVFRERGLTPDDVRTPEDLKKLPALTKETVRTHRDELVSLRARRKDLILNRTAGSTGEPLQFYQSRGFRDALAANEIRGNEMMGWRLGQPRAFAVGALRDAPRMSLLGRAGSRIARVRWLNTFRTTPEEMEAFARGLAAWEPSLLIGYSTSLEMFAEVVRQAGVEVPLIAVESSAEVLPPTMRRRIASALRTDVYDRYSCREFGNLAHECPVREGLHVFPDQHVVEFVKDGHSTAPGEDGTILVTSLTNDAMPLLRYELGDVSSGMAEACTCGRRSPRMRPLQGRVADFLLAPNGRIVHSGFFHHVFYHLQGIKKFQVIQETREFIRIRIVPTPDYDPAVEAKIRDELAWIDPTLTFEVEQVAAIERTPTGKLRDLVSKLPSPYRPN